MKTCQINRILPAFLFFISFIVSLPAMAAESPEAVAIRLQNHFDAIDSLRFDFTQDTRGQLSGRPKKGSGQAFFIKTRKNGQKTGKMRWNYSSPDKQVLVSNGVTFSMYFESMQQMIVTPADALQQDLTFSFFIGTGNLIEDFTILPADHEESSQDRVSIIKIIPKAKQSQVAAIHLWVTENSLIRRIEIRDHFDTLTVLNFSKLSVNTLDTNDTDLMNHLFQFTPPEGTEIIRQ